MKLTHTLMTLGIGAAMAFGLSVSANADEHEASEGAADVSGAIETGGGGEGDAEANGTDPRDLSAKFMPYYRFNRINNGLKSHEATLFGLMPIPIGEMLMDEPAYKWGVTYEFPALKWVNAERPVSTALSRIPPDPTIPLEQGVSAPSDVDPDVFGVGDLNTRLIAPIWQGEIGGLPVGLLTGFELWWPTASEDLLGTGKWQVAPHLTAVIDLAPGVFLASMNFWRTSFAGDDDRADIDLYVGRHFLNIPFGQSGYYMLAELQTICDLNDDNDWEVWFGPEVGKVLAPGRIVYAKPGFGLDSDLGEREWSFELGYRHFF